MTIREGQFNFSYCFFSFVFVLEQLVTYAKLVDTNVNTEGKVICRKINQPNFSHRTCTLIGLNSSCTRRMIRDFMFLYKVI